jgi:hypothetical protein
MVTTQCHWCLCHVSQHYIHFEVLLESGAILKSSPSQRQLVRMEMTNTTTSDGRKLSHCYYYSETSDVSVSQLNFARFIERSAR